MSPRPRPRRARESRSPEESPREKLDDFSAGFLLGLLVGEGHFGGDGRQAQVTLRMHVRHEKLFLWLKQVFPASRLYGPYDHGGRRYYQWMARGEFLERELVPLVASHLAHLDDYAAGRFQAMCERYGLTHGTGSGQPAKQSGLGADAVAPAGSPIPKSGRRDGASPLNPPTSTDERARR